jgi:hypothetical protein
LNDVAWQMEAEQMPMEWPMGWLEQYYGEQPQGVAMEWNVPMDITQLQPSQIPPEWIMLG